MGCFLACFGSSKNRKNRKQRHNVQPPAERNVSYNAQSTVSLEQSSLGTPINPVKEVGDDKTEEQPGSSSGSDLSARKKVTFDTNVKTYEHVLVDESTDFELHNEEGEKKLKVKEENLVKPRESENSSESSYPPNHRYRNCRHSDDEYDEELDYEESDLGDGEDDIEDYVGFNDGAVESNDRSLHGHVRVTEGEAKEESEPVDLIQDDVHPVLKPVENQDQWKVVKSKRSTQLKLQKENLSLEQEEPRLSKDGSFSFSEQVSVDASLSNWLSSRETTPAKRSGTFEARTPERSVSAGSIPMKMSPEDWPILGALTLEEINKYLAASSVPRRSPSRSPDERPIIGTVGRYWNHESSSRSSSKDSAACFKGIPNTSSKYREDKKVKWHSTPFEKRLERALNGGLEA